MPGLLWNRPLICMSHGSGYTPFSLTRGWKGGVTAQNARGWLGFVPEPTPEGESITEQFAVAVRPLLRPPPSVALRLSRALTVKSTPLYFSVCRPKLLSGTTRLLDELNFVGVMLSSPHS